MPSFVVDFVESGPFVPVFLFLYVAVAFRSSVVYWIGRYGVRLVASNEEHSSGLRKKAWHMVEARQTQKYAEKVRKGGWLVVSGAYLTIGIQSIVVIACAVIGLNWLQFAAAAALGWAAWALIYATIGFAVWRAATHAAAATAIGSPVTWIILAVIVVVVCAVIKRRRTATK